jgi:pimeloyl-ACP methyl ester carboxylesterase
MGRKLEQTLAVLNGLVGDYLARTQNGLTTDMACFRAGRPIALERHALAAAYPEPSARIALLVHGVMCDEAVWTMPDGSDYGSLLARDLGFTPAYLRYNTGRAIADSGAELSSLLERLLDEYPRPVEEILVIGYSMGGLVIRSACHAASQRGHGWLARVKRAIYVGTPHLGAPAERVGKLVAQVLHAIDDPYTRLVAEIGGLRSAGVKDLGHADLRHEDRTLEAALRDPRHPVPLLPQIAHYLIAGSLAADPWLAVLFGDAVVPIGSATYAARRDADPPLPPERVKVLPGLSHLALARHRDVYALIRRFCEEER